MAIIDEQEIEIRIILPHLGALRELQRGGRAVVKDLEKKEKSLTDAELSTADIRARRVVWEGVDGEEGVLGQLAEQMSMFTPVFRSGAPASETRDMFEDAPVASDPNPSTAARELMAPEALRDLLARAAQLYIPAAAIRRWPADIREQAEIFAQDALTAWEAGGIYPDVPALLVDYPLPEGVERDDDGLVRRGEDGEERIHDPVAWLEEVAAAEVELREEAALAVAPEGQVWVAVDVGYGEGLDRWQVMHRVTRERRRIAAEFVALWGDGTLADEDEANDGGPEECAAAYAGKLSAGEVQQASLAGDVAEGAKALRRALYRHGFFVQLASILAWTPEQRIEAAEWAEAAIEEPAPFLLQADVDPGDFDGRHPDDDFAAELDAEFVAADPAEPVSEAADSPVEDDDAGPAPAHVVSMLEKTGRRVPLHLVAAWSGAERDQVATWASSAPEKRVGWLPQVLRALQFERDPLNPEMVVVAGVPPRFTLTNKRKPVRIHDAATGLYFGDDWSVAEAEHIAGRWNAGVAADVRGGVLDVTAERVLLEPVTGAAAST